MEQKRDALEVLFDDKARSILFDLVDRNNSSQPTLSIEDDTLEPTISAVFSLFHDLMVKNTPDLYQAEWLRIIRAIENTRLQKHRLPVNTDAARCRVPCDHIPKRSYPLFRTRDILNDWICRQQEVS